MSRIGLAAGIGCCAAFLVSSPPGARAQMAAPSATPAASMAPAVNPSPAMGKVQTEAPQDEPAFLQALHKTNLQEVQLAKDAEKRASRNDVKKFARMLVKDHQGADREIEKYAKDAKLSLGSADDRKTWKAEADSQIAALKPLQGAEFDHAWLTQMVQGHEEALKTIDAGKSLVKGTEFRATLDGIRGKVNGHLDGAKDLLKQGENIQRTRGTEPGK